MSKKYITDNITIINAPSLDTDGTNKLYVDDQIASATVTEVNDLSSSVTWANIPIANVPTGTSGSTVALGNHTHSYLPLTGGTISGPLGNSGQVASSVITTPTRYWNIAAYYGSTNKTGTLVIELPTPLTHQMMKLRISGWSYDGAWEIMLGGYAHASRVPKRWELLSDIVVTGTLPFDIGDIRFTAADTAGTFYIFLGTTATVFAAQTAVTVDVLQAYSNNINPVGWDMYITLTEPTVDTTYTAAKTSHYGGLEAFVDGVITATGGSSTNWNTAYGWGDHSIQGYLTSETDSQTLTWTDGTNGLAISGGNSVTITGFADSTHTHLEADITDFGTYDNYLSWNLKTNGVQRTTITTGGILDIVQGANVTATYGAGGVVTIASTDTVYTHPTHPGDDFSVDSGPLTGATIISDIDINVTTDTLGHVTDANGVISTRELTLVDLGYTAYVLPEATAAVRGGIELFSDTDNPTAANTISSTASRTYGLQLNASGQGVVNVPWTDTDNNDNFYTTGLSYASATSILTATVTGASSVTVDLSNLIEADALKVTGDGTTSQYLRSDGDGSFTWATPTNTTYSATLVAGAGISGTTYNPSTSTTFNLALSELGVATMAAGDWIAFDNAGVSNKALISTIPLSLFNDDLGHTSDTNFYITALGYTSATSILTATVSGASNPTVDLSNAIYADALAVTGNGTTAQYLRSDGDGTFTWATPGGVTNHTALSNIGTNTHAQIDTHIADATKHFTQAAISITESQVSDLQAYLLAADINTLAELNAIVGDATLIDTGDSRLSDARTPTSHTHLEADISDLKAYLLAVGTPVSKQIAIFDNGDLAGDANFTWNPGTRVLDVAGVITTGQLTITETTGTAPFVISSTTMVAKLNAEYLGGLKSEEYKLNDILVTNTNIGATHSVDWSKDVHKLTATEACTFSDTNLPTYPKTITLYVTGAFALTAVAAWNLDLTDYDGAEWNRITIDFVETGFYSADLKVV